MINTKTSIILKKSTRDSYYLRLIKRKDRVDQLPGIIIALILLVFAAFILG